MSIAHRSIFAAMLALAGLAGPCAAQPVPFYYSSPGGPSVLGVDPDSGLPIVPPNRPDLASPPAVPVPQVMNGGGFGMTGFSYYNDGPGEGQLGRGHQTRQYVIAPAYKGPLGIR